jgi:polyhydroxybutyrate depolymerase
MIHLMRHLGKGVQLLRRRRQPLTLASTYLFIFLSFWCLASCGSLAPTLKLVVPAKAGKTLIAFSAKSAGCGKPSPVVPGTSVDQSVLSGGITRSYLLHIPRGYDDTTAQALVLNFHGHGSSALNQEHLTGFSVIADTYDVIVAYPQGVAGPDHHTGWDTGLLRDPATNDVLFVSNLLRHLQSKWCIDLRRIYAVGFSNGGGMTNLLACRLAGRIAAFASVSGAYPPVPGGCHPVRPVPFIELHGTGDRVVPYRGSLAKGYPPVTRWLQQWAQRDGCASGPVVFFDQDGVVGERWMGCRGNVSIVHYTIDGMGHIWPRHVIIRFRDQVTTLDASTLIWAFIRSYTLPQNSSIA